MIFDWLKQQALDKVVRDAAAALPDHPLQSAAEESLWTAVGRAEAVAQCQKAEAMARAAGINMAAYYLRLAILELERVDGPKNEPPARPFRRRGAVFR